MLWLGGMSLVSNQLVNGLINDKCSLSFLTYVYFRCVVIYLLDVFIYACLLIICCVWHVVLFLDGLAYVGYMHALDP
jgi:hypothetical protein